MKMCAEIHYTLHNETSLDVLMKEELTFEDSRGEFASLSDGYKNVQEALHNLDLFLIKIPELRGIMWPYRRFLLWRRWCLSRRKRKLVHFLLNSSIGSTMEVVRYAGPDTGPIDAHAARQIAKRVPEAHTIRVYPLNS